MKKSLLALVFVFGLGVSAKGLDPFCVKNHESVILNDHQWHTLTYAYKTGGYNWSTAKIKIRQTDTGIDYEFKDTSENEVLRFSSWLWDSEHWTYDYSYELHDKIKIEKEGSDYVGRFTSEVFVPGLDENYLFIGIDVF